MKIRSKNVHHLLLVLVLVIPSILLAQTSTMTIKVIDHDETTRTVTHEISTIHLTDLTGEAIRIASLECEDPRWIQLIDLKEVK